MRKFWLPWAMAGLVVAGLGANALAEKVRMDSFREAAFCNGSLSAEDIKAVADKLHRGATSEADADKVAIGLACPGMTP